MLLNIVPSCFSSDCIPHIYLQFEQQVLLVLLLVVIDTNIAVDQSWNEKKYIYIM